MGIRGAEFIALALKENCCLTFLSLKDNAIRDKGACFLADALKSNIEVENVCKNFRKIEKYIRKAKKEMDFMFKMDEKISNELKVLDEG